MVSEYSMLFQKVVKEQSAYSFTTGIPNYALDLEEDFGMAVLEMPHIAQGTIKEPPSQSYRDEHGEDVYNSPTASIKFDKEEIEIKLGTRGTASQCNERISNLLEYMSTKGIIFSFYSPWICEGRKRARFGGVSNYDFSRKDGETTVMFDLKIVIVDPVTKVSVTENNNNYTIN